MSHIIMAIAAAIALFSLNAATTGHGAATPVVMDAIPPSGL
jgi:hypothetical protein